MVRRVSFTERLSSAQSEVPLCLEACPSVVFGSGPL